KKGIKDECSRLLEASTMKSRRGFAIQRLMNAMRQAHADGWFIVFDTLTLADDRLEAFYDNATALRDYFRDIGRMVLAVEGRKANDAHTDCYQYFCVPEYATANGRLHVHAVHVMRTHPTGSVDPNFGRRVRNRRQLFFFQAEDGIRDYKVTGVQTCALPIYSVYLPCRFSLWTRLARATVSMPDSSINSFSAPIWRRALSMATPLRRSLQPAPVVPRPCATSIIESLFYKRPPAREKEESREQSSIAVSPWRDWLTPESNRRK